MIGIILCRKGSKRFVGKNTALFLGDPLIINTINIAFNAGITKLFISTDDSEIKKLVGNINNVSILDRNENLCQDKTTTEEVLINILQNINEISVCLLQVTSPCLKSKTLRNAIEKYNDEKLHSLIGVNHHYAPVGAFYIFNIEMFLITHSIYNINGDVVILSNEECIDIDYKYQLQIAEIIMKSDNNVSIADTSLTD